MRMAGCDLWLMQWMTVRLRVDLFTWPCGRAPVLELLHQRFFRDLENSAVVKYFAFDENPYRVLYSLSFSWTSLTWDSYLVALDSTARIWEMHTGTHLLPSRGGSHYWLCWYSQRWCYQPNEHPKHRAFTPLNQCSRTRSQVEEEKWWKGGEWRLIAFEVHPTKHWKVGGFLQCVLCLHSSLVHITPGFIRLI